MVLAQVSYCIFYSQYKLGIQVLVTCRNGRQVSKQSYWMCGVIGQEISHQQIPGWKVLNPGDLKNRPLSDNKEEGQRVLSSINR